MFGDELDLLECTLEAMVEAADQYTAAASARQMGDHGYASRREESGEEYLADAEECGLLEIDLNQE